MQLSLLVLYSPDPVACRDFYASLGMVFTEEQHGTGPVHHAAVLDGGVVVEIYPAGPGRETNRLRLGFTGLAGEKRTLVDPDGRKVDLA